MNMLFFTFDYFIQISVPVRSTRKTLKTLFISFVAFLCSILFICPISNSIVCSYFVTDCLLVLNSN